MKYLLVLPLIFLVGCSPKLIHNRPPALAPSSYIDPMDPNAPAEYNHYPACPALWIGDEPMPCEDIV